VTHDINGRAAMKENRVPRFDPCGADATELQRWAHEILAHRHRSEIFQTSTMGALLDGVYEGNLRIRELLRYGDFGLGTFNRLDGEMLVLDGVCYQLRGDGSATIADPEELTPFAAVTWFHPDRAIDVSVPHDRAALKARIDEVLESTNLMLAVRVTGHFSVIRTRTVTEQHPPYRPFTEATQDQQEVTFTDVTGTLAGFRMPDYEQGISVAGYHSHFIDTDHRHGGHTLDYQLVRGTVEIGVRSELHLSLQRTPEFLGAELKHSDLDGKIRQTEGE
jgi:acetolactate decarboxylase